MSAVLSRRHHHSTIFSLRPDSRGHRNLERSVIGSVFALYAINDKESNHIMDIFVGNLPYDADESAIKAAFSPYGTIARVKLLIDRDTGSSRGIAFVTMDDFKEAQNAIREMDGKELGGRALKVNQAREGGQGGGGPRQGGGGFRSGGGSNFRSGGNGGGGGGFRGRDRY